uniref:Thioesterase superfamily protein n=1 Tax=Caenorhabditis tropicalis TaxID=1561998 RepID=A0A1I7TGC3_9PELO
MDGSLIRMIVGQLGQGWMRSMVPTFGEEMIVEASHLNIKLAIPASAINGVGKTAFFGNLEAIGFLAAEVAYQLQPMATENMIRWETTFQWEEIPQPRGVFIFHAQVTTGELGWFIDVLIDTKEEGKPKTIGFGMSSLIPEQSQRTSDPPGGSSSMSPAASGQGMSPPPPPSSSLKRAVSSLQLTSESQLLEELEAVSGTGPSSSKRQAPWAELFSSPPRRLFTDEIVAPAKTVLPADSDVQELVNMMAVNVISHTFTSLEAILKSNGIEPLRVTREVIPIKFPSRAIYYFQVASEDVRKMSHIMMAREEWAFHFILARYENWKTPFFAPAVSMTEVIETFFLAKQVAIETVKHGIPCTDNWAARLRDKNYFRQAIAVQKERDDVLSMLNSRGREIYKELKKKVFNEQAGAK